MPLSEIFTAVYLRALVDVTSSVSMEMNSLKTWQDGTDIGPRSDPQERRYRRFNIRYPVSLRVGLGDSVSEFRAVSNNISIGGVLLESDLSIPQHCDVTFTIQVQGHDIIGPTQIVGEGEVVRVEPHRSGAGFAIAVRCKHPISELPSCLPASTT